MSASTRPTSPVTCTRPARSIIAALAASTILLTGCSASSTQSAVEPAPAAAPGMPAAAGGQAGNAERAESAPDAAGGGVIGYTSGQERMVARTASLTLVVDDVRATGERIRAMAATLDGWVAHESLTLTSADGRSMPTAGSWISLSVPASRLDDTIARVGEMGTVRDRQASAQDVTDAVVDLDARIKSLEASVARLQELVGRSGSVADIAAVERELATRQADLEAMKSQRLHYAGVVERSTLTIALLTPTQSTSTNPIQTGWSRGSAAFLESVAILITVVAALLPFALLVALIAVPVVLVLRARRRKSTPRPEPEPQPQRHPDAEVGPDHPDDVETTQQPAP